MITVELHKHNIPHIINVDSSTRITVSFNPLLNSAVYYEQATEHQAKLKIGKFCSIAARTSFFLGGYHNINRISTWIPSQDMNSNLSRELLTKGDIIIENDVWIGQGAVIMSGTRIGTGAVIGTNALIAKDVEPYSIVVGNPGKAVKKRFNDEQIKILLESEWWNWDFEIIKQNSQIIFGESFEDFKKLVESKK